MERSLRAKAHEGDLVIWEERVQTCRNSGMSIKQWCAENGIDLNTYYRWQRKVFAASPSAQETFYEVPIQSGIGKAAISIEINGLVAKVHYGADEETIQAVLRAMKSC